MCSALYIIASPLSYFVWLLYCMSFNLWVIDSFFCIFKLLFEILHELLIRSQQTKTGRDNTTKTSLIPSQKAWCCFCDLSFTNCIFRFDLRYILPNLPVQATRAPGLFIS